MTNPYSPAPELNSASSEAVTKVTAHGVSQQFPCYLLLLSFCLLAYAVTPYALRTMLDPSCLAANERPSGPAMMAILGATGVTLYGIFAAVLAILTPFSWFRTRLIEIAMRHYTWICLKRV